MLEKFKCIKDSLSKKIDETFPAKNEVKEEIEDEWVTHRYPRKRGEEVKHYKKNQRTGERVDID